MLLLALACRDEPPPCPSRIVIDGDCVDTEPTGTTPTETASTTDPDAMDLLEADWADCEATSGDDTLDLLAGCVRGVCGGQTYADAVSAFREADAFDDSDVGYVYASWADEFGAWYPDGDEDGEPDVGARCTWIMVNPEAVVSTADGLGPGSSMRCFVDALGGPDRIELEHRAKQWQIISLYWDDDDLKVWDWLNQRGSEKSDGAADYVYLSY
jgi:hypothetical protein